MKVEEFNYVEFGVHMEVCLKIYDNRDYYKEVIEKTVFFKKSGITNIKEYKNNYKKVEADKLYNDRSFYETTFSKKMKNKKYSKKVTQTVNELLKKEKEIKNIKNSYIYKYKK